MLTRLSDIFDPQVYQDLPSEISPEKTDFFTSGIVARTPLMDSLANADGRTAELPYWKDIDANVEVNYSDDSENVATPANVVQGEMVTRKVFSNKGFKEADLAAELAVGGDALSHVKRRIDTYFTRQWQRRLIACTNGMLAGNIANNAGDMVINVATEDGDNATADNKFNLDCFTESVYTMGDAASDLKTIVVHSHVMKQMVKNDDIDYISDSKGENAIATFRGLRVIVDDSMPVVAGDTSGFKYTSVIFGANVFGYGVGSPKVPVEVERNAAQGLGGGTETIWYRKTEILHPLGFTQSGTPAGVSFTQAELAQASSWTRVVSDRKALSLAWLVTN